MKVIEEIQAGKLKVKEYKNRVDLGKASASEMSYVLKRLLMEKDEINIIFAAAPSQNEFLEALINSEDINWKRVNGFHIGETVE